MFAYLFGGGICKWSIETHWGLYVGKIRLIEKPQNFV